MILLVNRAIAHLFMPLSGHRLQAAFEQTYLFGVKFDSSPYLILFDDGDHRSVQSRRACNVPAAGVFNCGDRPDC